MKIAITSAGKYLDAQVDQNFGRYAYFLIDRMTFEARDEKDVYALRAQLNSILDRIEEIGKN